MQIGGKRLLLSEKRAFYGSKAEQVMTHLLFFGPHQKLTRIHSHMYIFFTVKQYPSDAFQGYNVLLFDKHHPEIALQGMKGFAGTVNKIKHTCNHSPRKLGLEFISVYSPRTALYSTVTLSQHRY